MLVVREAAVVADLTLGTGVPSSAAVALVVVVAEHVGRVAHVAQEHDMRR